MKNKIIVLGSLAVLAVGLCSAGDFDTAIPGRDALSAVNVPSASSPKSVRQVRFSEERFGDAVLRAGSDRAWEGCMVLKTGSQPSEACPSGESKCNAYLSRRKGTVLSIAKACTPVEDPCWVNEDPCDPTSPVEMFLLLSGFTMNEPTGGGSTGAGTAAEQGCRVNNQSWEASASCGAHAVRCYADAKINGINTHVPGACVPNDKVESCYSGHPSAVDPCKGSSGFGGDGPAEQGCKVSNQSWEVDVMCGAKAVRCYADAVINGMTTHIQGACVPSASANTCLGGFSAAVNPCKN